jgi:hypothetical protein
MYIPPACAVMPFIENLGNRNIPKHLLRRGPYYVVNHTQKNTLFFFGKKKKKKFRHAARDN